MTLIEEINKEIKNSGGRITLAHIIVEESPGWFSIEFRRSIRWSAMDTARHRLKASKMKRSPKRWTKEDTDYLLDKYGTMKTSRLANILERRSDSCIQKFFAIASPARISQLPKIKRGGHY